MTSPRTLTWLHLSDLHRCSSRDGGAGEVVLRRLIEDLEHLRDTEDLRPDLARKSPKVYGLRAEDVFVVPGNHDVDRGVHFLGHGQDTEDEVVDLLRRSKQVAILDNDAGDL